MENGKIEIRIFNSQLNLRLRSTRIVTFPAFKPEIIVPERGRRRAAKEIHESRAGSLQLFDSFNSRYVDSLMLPQDTRREKVCPSRGGVPVGKFLDWREARNPTWSRRTLDTVRKHVGKHLSRNILFILALEHAPSLILAIRSRPTSPAFRRKPAISISSPRFPVFLSASFRRFIVFAAHHPPCFVPSFSLSYIVP